MDFENLYWIWFGLAIATILVIYKIFIKKKLRKTSKRISDSQIFKKFKKSPKIFNKENILFFLTILIILSLAFALSGPSIDSDIPKKGINVILVLDKSGTMQYAQEDVSRLDKAKKIANDIVNRLDSNDFVGLVEFGRNVRVPLCLSSKDNIDFSKRVKEVGQTDDSAAIGDALYTAVDMASSFTNTRSIIFLLSDGVNVGEFFSINDSINYAVEAKTTINTIYLGSKEPVFFVYDLMEDGVTPYKNYIQPGYELLMDIAHKTNGSYYDSENMEKLNNFFADIEKEFKKEKEPKPLKNFFLFIASIAFLTQLLLKEIWDVL